MTGEVCCDNCQERLVRTRKDKLPFLDVMLRQFPPRGVGSNLEICHFCNYHCLSLWAQEKTKEV
jgi:hypothetical protein